jgi:hypothetical protein
MAVRTTRLVNIALKHTLRRMLGSAGAADTVGLRPVQARVASKNKERFRENVSVFEEYCLCRRGPHAVGGRLCCAATASAALYLTTLTSHNSLKAANDGTL